MTEPDDEYRLTAAGRTAAAVMSPDPAPAVPAGVPAAVIRKADVDILVAACAVFLPSDVSPEVTDAFGRLLTAWDDAGGWTDGLPARPDLPEWLCGHCRAVHPHREGDRFTVPCPGCGTPMAPTSPLLRDYQQARAEIANLRRQLDARESTTTAPARSEGTMP